MFIVVELQTVNGQTSNIVTAHATQEEAESKYHTILAYAAINTSVEKHSAVILTDEGFSLDYKCYKHTVVTPVEE